ncbi:MAG: hypothetical protein ACRDE5_13270 [Ginsengibacter sp.]
MKLKNEEINFKLFIPIIIIILFFRMPSDKTYPNPKPFPGVSKTHPEKNIYPSLQYEKHLQIAMLVEDTGALTKKGKEHS